jgi:hypothetical protein
MAKKKSGGYSESSASKPKFGKYVKNVKGKAEMGKKSGKKKSSGY